VEEGKTWFLKARRRVAALAVAGCGFGLLGSLVSTAGQQQQQQQPLPHRRRPRQQQQIAAADRVVVLVKGVVEWWVFLG
jgi:hypothetical protein